MDYVLCDIFMDGVLKISRFFCFYWSGGSGLYALAHHFLKKRATRQNEMKKMAKMVSFFFVWADHELEAGIAVGPESTYSPPKLWCQENMSDIFPSPTIGGLRLSHIHHSIPNCHTDTSYSYLLIFVLFSLHFLHCYPYTSWPFSA